MCGMSMTWFIAHVTGSTVLFFLCYLITLTVALESVSFVYKVWRCMAQLVIFFNDMLFPK